MADNETIVEREQAMLATGEEAVEKLRQMVHGDKTTVVELESGQVPSLQKWQADAGAFFEDAAVRAEAARDDTVSGALIADDVADGLAKTDPSGADGKPRHFRIIAPGSNEAFIYYRHDIGGVATEVTRIASNHVVRENVDKVEGMLRAYTGYREEVIAGRSRGGLEWGDPESFKGWSVGIDLEGVAVNYIDFDLRFVNSNSVLTLKIYSRDPANNFGPGSLSGDDSLLYEKSYSPSMFNDSSDYQSCRFDFPLIEAPSGRRLLFTIEGDVMLAVGRFSGDAGAPWWARGYFRQGSAWGAIPEGYGVAFSSGFKYQALPDFALKGEVESLAADTSAVLSLTEPADAVIFSRAKTGMWLSTRSFQRWSFGQGVAAGDRVDALGVHCDGVGGNESIELKVYFRPATSEDIGAAGTSNSDQLHDTVVFPVSGFEAGLQPQDLKLPHKPFIAPAAGVLLYSLKAIGGLGTIGLAKASLGAGGQMERGYFSFSTSPSIWGAISPSPAAAAFTLYQAVRKIKESALPASVGGEQSAASLSDAYSLSVEVAGLGVRVYGSLSRNGEEIAVDSAVQLAAQPIESATKDVELRYSAAGTWVFNPNAYLGHRNVSNPLVVRLSDSLELEIGTDYQLNTNGRLWGLVDTEPQNCRVTYDYSLTRYDVIQIDAETQQLSAVAGTARDADVLEYIPKASLGKVPLYLARVVGGTVTDVLPLWLFDGVRRAGSEPDWLRLRSRNAAALRKFSGKISRGAGVTIAGYGDSITALQHGYPGYSPNGPNRDLASGYLSFFPEETVAAIPKFDFGDGAGSVHVKIGFNWRLVEEVERLSGAEVQYLNFGIGGTASANSEGHGLWPARLSEVLLAAPDLVVLAFGMNELGSSSTYANMVSIVNQLKAAGCEVAVVSVPRINTPEYKSQAAWRKTNRDLERVAIATDSAFVPFHWIADDRHIAGLRAAIPDTCAANLYNHPGLAELRRYGAVLVESLL